MLEVMEEEELENLRDQQRRFQVSSMFPSGFPSWNYFLYDNLGNTKAGTMCNSKTGRARTETYTRKRTTNCSTERGLLYRKQTGSGPGGDTSGLIPNQGSFSFQVRKKEKETAEKIAARAYAQDYLMGK